MNIPSQSEVFAETNASLGKTSDSKSVLNVEKNVFTGNNQKSVFLLEKNKLWKVENTFDKLAVKEETLPFDSTDIVCFVQNKQVKAKFVTAWISSKVKLTISLHSSKSILDEKTVICYGSKIEKVIQRDSLVYLIVSDSLELIKIQVFKEQMLVFKPIKLESCITSLVEAQRFSIIGTYRKIFALDGHNLLELAEMQENVTDLKIEGELLFAVDALGNLLELNLKTFELKSLAGVEAKGYCFFSNNCLVVADYINSAFRIFSFKGEEINSVFNVVGWVKLVENNSSFAFLSNGTRSILWDHSTMSFTEHSHTKLMLFNP